MNGNNPAALAQATQQLLAALNAMLTHAGMDEDEWTKPTFDQARAAVAAAELALATPPDAMRQMATTAEMEPAELASLPRKLLDVACRVRVGEALHRDHELIDQAAHAINGALRYIAPAASAAPLHIPAVGT